MTTQAEAAELILQKAEPRLFAEIPVKYQTPLRQYVEGHIYPGPVLSAWLGRNWGAYYLIAPHVRLSDYAAEAIEAWLGAQPYRDCFGSVGMVSDWVAARTEGGTTPLDLRIKEEMSK